jgi:ParB-like chromosome segregation protein Spo0J
MAAKEMGLATVPCIVLGHLTSAQRKAYVIADNKLALNAGWDFATLTEQLCELEALDFDVALTGFSPEEFPALTAKHTAGMSLIRPMHLV